MSERFWIGVLVLVIISGALSQYRSTTEERYRGFVISKEYSPEYTYIEVQGRDPKGNFPKYGKKYMPEVFEITVSYELVDREGNNFTINPKELTFDNKEYYDFYEEGFPVWVVHTVVHDAFGRTVEDEYTLEKCGT